MIAIFLSPIYILANIYLARWLLRWLKQLYKLFGNKKVVTILIIIYTLCASSLLIGFFLPNNTIGRIVKVFANYWLGVLLYSLLFTIIIDGIRIILKNTKYKKKKFNKKIFMINGLFCIAFIFIITVYGVLNAFDTRVTNYNVNIDKKTDISNLNIIMLADLHLGYNTDINQIEDVVNKINNNNPDLVVIAGDIFDNNYDAIKEPEKIIELFKNIRSRYGVYAVYGNHDIKEKILAGFTFNGKAPALVDSRMTEMLEQSNINLLQDESVLIDNSFYLIGRLDLHKTGLISSDRMTPSDLVEGLDQNKPIIVIDHEPAELDELSDVGVDLDLSGHTHDGQVFPFDILVKLFWRNSYGMMKVNNMYSIVTSGVGVFGPNMRIGTHSEITVINVLLN